MPTSDTHTGPGLAQRTLNLMEEVTHKLRDRRGALIPILHAVQESFGYIPEDTIPIVGDYLNVTRAEVYGVVTFYSDFRTAPPGSRVVQVCQAESCQAMGSALLVAAARETLGVDFEETTPDKEFTLRKVFCLGNCARSPSVMIDGEIHGCVTREKLLRILKEARSGS